MLRFLARIALATILAGCSPALPSSPPPSSAKEPSALPMDAATSIVGFAVAYENGPGLPDLVTLLPEGRVGERRKLGYDPQLALTSRGVLVVDLGTTTPESGPDSGTITLLPLLGATAIWTVAAAPPPVRVDGPVTRMSAVSLGTNAWYQSSVLQSGGFYVDGLALVDLSGEVTSVTELGTCGVAAIAVTTVVAVQCGANRKLHLLAGGAIANTVSVIGQDPVGVAAIGGDTFVIVGQAGDVVAIDNRGRRVPFPALAPGVSIPFGAVSASGQSVAVGLGSSDLVSQGQFDRVAVSTDAGPWRSWKTPRPSQSLAIGANSIAIALGPCVEMHTLDGGKVQDWCGLGDVAQILLLSAAGR